MGGVRMGVGAGMDDFANYVMPGHQTETQFHSLLIQNPRKVATL
jgi:hypothetical protein